MDDHHPFFSFVTRRKGMKKAGIGKISLRGVKISPPHFGKNQVLAIRTATWRQNPATA
ncbi:MAG: hypothetical protein LUE17_11125 [Planctomycetaceae bacterium]|nr:hypothetical protein [Planctomycetaceae bacterium]